VTTVERPVCRGYGLVPWAVTVWFSMAVIAGR
jgi:hypothetical protein